MTKNKDDFWYKLLTLGDAYSTPSDGEFCNAYIWNGLMYLARTRIAKNDGDKFYAGMFAGKSRATEEQLKNILSSDYSTYVSQIINRLNNKWKITIEIPDISEEDNRLDFSQCVFLAHLEILIGHSPILSTFNFKGCHFEKMVHLKTDLYVTPSISFNGAYFKDDVDFSETVLNRADFVRVKFNAHTNFYKSEIQDTINFYEAEFYNIQFDDTKFFGDSNFSNAKFSGMSYFKNTIWKKECDFSGSKFIAATPEFYGAEIPPEILFTNITLPRVADMIRHTDDKSALFTAEKSYEYLAKRMQEMGREQDRHLFYRHEMRMKEGHANGGTLAAKASYLYGLLTDYGYGLGRVFSFWLINILWGWLGMWAAIVTNTKTYSSFSLVSNLLAQSFSNSHPFLFLRRGWLNVEKEELLLSNGVELSLSSDALAYINFIAGAQAILGVIIFYFLLLTLRNRFKM